MKIISYDTEDYGKTLSSIQTFLKDKNPNNLSITINPNKEEKDIYIVRQDGKIMRMFDYFTELAKQELKKKIIDIYNSCEPLPLNAHVQ